jgi:hypothetical protein
LASSIENRFAKPTPQMACDTPGITSLTPIGGAMIDAYGFPVVASGSQAREEQPSRGLHIEAGIVDQPVPDGRCRSASQRRKLGNPGAVDLKWAEVMSAIGIQHFRTDPSGFLITQAP